MRWHVQDGYLYSPEGGNPVAKVVTMIAVDELLAVAVQLNKAVRYEAQILKLTAERDELLADLTAVKRVEQSMAELGDFIDQVEERNRMSAQIEELKAALREAVERVKFLREYASRYEILQAARGYPPTAEAAAKGVELTAWLAALDRTQ